MENFTPVASLIGGVLIGLAAVGMLLFDGRIGGVSGIFGGFLNAKHGDTAWRAAFIGGLMAGGLVMLMLKPDTMTFGIDRSVLSVVVAGILVGIGARLGSGCTSGHGVCGIGRLAPRSLVASAVFMSTGAAAAIVVGEVFGGKI
ncbi:MAG TPA: YeeE/YedE family protein [Chromatiaceae bacterium]|nr:YeeE/YedE family protein [Chromatiaceae bacterium]HIN81983.1 YeeE/YedE family protein [Chromatiales bacterium]HIA07579.1 YeeE/YedE family protein [Chromatiaceae bacterium]HIB83384.1 YeeE/YedE family protein [Chromatiaceae bacterium]HIO14440.1 YeeE/YedE family protein [Chromatiales bacterium]